MERAIGLRGAIAVNVIAMIGIGPLVTIPLVLSALHGPLALIAWIAGAVVALCDGLVWAELSSRFPGSGGTYVYLREVFGARRWGTLWSFLFNWQLLLAAPCLLASGYIGLANYAGYAFPSIAASRPLAVGLEMSVGLITIAALYRKTRRVAALGTVLAICSIGTLLIVIAAALPHADLHRAFTLPASLPSASAFLGGFGSALFITLYDYSGYAEVALVGDEVRAPHRTIPRAIVLAVVIVAAAYVLLQLGVLGTVPWQTLVGTGGAMPAQAQYVASLIVANTWGRPAALAVTLLVLVTAFASVYGLLFGVSRIPYAAARDGEFPAIFARLHPRGEFPYVSLLAIGGASLIACFFTLDQVIAFLTAGIVLIQGVMQIVALGVLRVRRERAPYRMPLFPLPALIALAGWIFAFVASGALAIELGVAWLAAGVAVYVIWAARARRWPFAAALAIALCVFMPPPSARATVTPSWSAWHASAVTHANGYPLFTVNGWPFFVYGAAFFYERVPRAQWASSLAAYRAMGINTIDLYLIWNWHEVRPGTFDFTGSTDDRRDLPALFALIHHYGFKVIVRPGPVIRNEWRNGGYPAWLLERPEYAMPLHDVLEGRYPATATLQNAQADAAAAQWLRNATHRAQAARWLHAVLHAIAPWSSNVIAIALDDDQGAYIDNDTWPAPHWHAYINWLAGIVRASVGARVPLFVNTYQMKVTAASPVWAWGNWYQSDAYAIGDHDLAQLAFSTALLQTQPGLPVMASEFQAGWLQGADETAPRPADPSNTTLALHELLQLGAHGVVNFPVQDTLDPAGWAAPWANWSYAWDAALRLDGTPSARYAPTAAFGALLARAPYLATLHPKADLAIAWLVDAYDPALMTNARVASIAAATIAAQQRCHALALTCRFIDLRYDSLADLRETPRLVLPPTGIPLRFNASIEMRLAAYRRVGGRTFTDVDFAAVGIAPSNGGIRDAALLVSPHERYGMLDVFNASFSPRRIPATTVLLGQRALHLAAFTIPPRSARDFVLGTPPVTPARPPAALARAAPLPPQQPAAQSRAALHGSANGAMLSLDVAAALQRRAKAGAYAPVGAGAARATIGDLFDDGTPWIVLQNRYVRAVIATDAGARAFVFENVAGTENAFTTIGSLRDDVATPPTPSPRDYIAAYTHPFEAGTFNRAYACAVTQSGPRAQARCTYDAPDLAAASVHFEKTFTLDPDTRTLVVELRSSADAVSISVVTAQPWLIVRCDARCDDTVTAGGYRLLRAHYAAGNRATLSFTLQGPPSPDANRR